MKHTAPKTLCFVLSLLSQLLTCRTFPADSLIVTHRHPTGIYLSNTPQALTTALLKISYDGGRFTGWSAANDVKINDEEIVCVQLEDTSPPPRPIRRYPSRRKQRQQRQLGGGNTDGPGFVRSVQGLLTTALAKLYGNVAVGRIVVEGCSRTDKGVHAHGLVAQFYCLKENLVNVTLDIPGKALPHPKGAYDDTYFVPLPMELWKMLRTLNRMLPYDVRVMEIAPVPTYSPLFHPTLSARNKTYVYTLSVGTLQDPMEWRRQWHVDTEVWDIQAMQHACQLLQGQHNFAAWQGAPRSKTDKQLRLTQSTVCIVESITITSRVPGECRWPHAEQVTLAIRGDRFLYKMVRFLAGSLVAVGRHQLTMDDIHNMLQTGQRTSAFPCAPAKGLVLEHVDYGDINIDWQ